MAPSGTTHIDCDRMVGVTTLGDQMFFSLVYSELEISPAQIKQLQQKVMQFLGEKLCIHLVQRP
jgi:hypothetical protein